MPPARSTTPPSSAAPLSRRISPWHARQRALRRRPKPSAPWPFSTGPRPTAPSWRKAVEDAVMAINGYPASSGCPFTGLPPDSCDGAHNLPHSEKELARLFVWAVAHGLIPPTASARDLWKILPQNLFQCAKNLHCLLADGALRKLLLWPSRNALLATIRSAEARLAAAEDEVRQRAANGEDVSGWELPVDGLLEEGSGETLPLDEEVRASAGAPADGLALFEYRLLLFEEPSQAKVRAAQLARFDPVKDEVVTPKACKSDVLPTRFKPDLPRARLPLSLILVVLSSLGHLRYIRDRLPNRRYAREFLQEIRWADYLLSMIESKHPSSWRKFRPDDLGFEAPQAHRLHDEGPCWTARRRYTLVTPPGTARTRAAQAGSAADLGGGQHFSSPPMGSEALDVDLVDFEGLVLAEGSDDDDEVADGEDDGHSDGSGSGEEESDGASEDAGADFFGSDSEADTTHYSTPDSSLAGTDDGAEDEVDGLLEEALAEVSVAYNAEQALLIRRIQDPDDEDAAAAKSVRMAPFLRDEDAVEGLSQDLTRLLLAATKQEEAREALQEVMERHEEEAEDRARLAAWYGRGEHGSFGPVGQGQAQSAH